MTDRDKDEVDAAAKKTLRELNIAVRNLQDAEEMRQNTEKIITQKKYKKLGGALVSWAAGGAGQTKSFDQEVDEARSNAITVAREGVILYLRQKLNDCVNAQSSMMEKRINRDLEKRRSVLANAKSKAPELSTFNASMNNYSPTSPTQTGTPQYRPEDLSEEQVQMFEKDNQDMLKHYESTLNQVT